jgi:hypothetical protein
MSVNKAVSIAMIVVLDRLVSTFPTYTFNTILSSLIELTYNVEELFGRAVGSIEWQ